MQSRSETRAHQRSRPPAEARSAAADLPPGCRRAIIVARLRDDVRSAATSSANLTPRANGAQTWSNSGLIQA
jgi:hypothetical protein